MKSKNRFTINELTLVAGAISALTIVGIVLGWVFTRGNVLQNYKTEMNQVATIVKSGFPYFFETGKSLITKQSDFDLSAVPNEYRSGFLSQINSTIPFFQQLVLLDSQGRVLSTIPSQGGSAISLSTEDLARVRYIVSGQTSQIYVVSSPDSNNSGLVSFMHSIQQGTQGLQGILLGRTDLNSNLQVKPFIDALNSLSSFRGSGIILDEYHRIIYSSSATDILAEYPTSQLSIDNFVFAFDKNARTSLIYAFVIPGQQWMGVLSIPRSQVNFAIFLAEIPFILILLVIAAAFILLYIFFFRRFEQPIKSLVDKAGQIAAGKSQVTFGVNSNHQIRELDHSLEAMRKNLNERIEQLSLLNQIDLKINPQADIETAIKPYLEAALHFDADATRLVLLPAINLQPGQKENLVFQEGATAELYSYLDDQILEYVRNQNLLILPDTTRIRQLKFLPGFLRPGALVAVPLTLKNSERVGVLEILFDKPRNFSKAEIQYYSDLLDKLIHFLEGASKRHQESSQGMVLEKLFTVFPDPILLVGKGGKVNFHNLAILKISEFFKESKDGFTLNDPELLKLLNIPASDLPAQKEIKTKTGKTFSVGVLPESGETPEMGKVFLFKDITPEKEKLGLQADFISVVSHDLRSPLTLARGYVNMLEMVGSLNDQQKSFVGKISGSIDHMNRLANNLLDLERFETGSGVRFEEIDPRNITESIINALSPQASQKNIHLNQTGDWANIGLIDADPILLNQAIYNLVENAVKFTPVSGKVTLETQLEEPNITFVVKDTGVGIAPIDLASIFQKAYRPTQREPDQPRGSGLGLAIVKFIAERHHGMVWVESQLGKGCSFYFQIPIHQSGLTGDKAAIS
jgi:two-component system, OmpR family, phosphate regulon sensor histidine kinase PhoR